MDTLIKQKVKDFLNFQEILLEEKIKGWQAVATWIGADKILLIKDDLVWTTKTEYTTNNNEITLTQITDYFPAIQNYVFLKEKEKRKTLYQDIFEFGFIQSIGRTREDNNTVLMMFL